MKKMLIPRQLAFLCSENQNKMSQAKMLKIHSYLVSWGIVHITFYVETALFKSWKTPVYCTRMVMLKFKEGKTGGLEKHSQDFNMKLT